MFFIKENYINTFVLKRLIASFALLFLISYLTKNSLALQVAEGAIENEFEVLVISSYDTEFPSVPLQIQGINSAIDGHKVHLDVENMNSKKYDTQEYRELFYGLIKYKISNNKIYDAIIASDDSALQFVMDYREELFPEIPVVFLGINDRDRADKASGLSKITGIFEELYIDENINIGLSINNDANTVVAIVDDSITGIGDKKQFNHASKNFENLDFILINASEYSYDSLKYELKKLDKDKTILFYLSLYKDSYGTIKSVEEISELLFDSAKIPILRPTIGGIGNGILGGRKIDYYDMGLIAGQMLVEILHGKDPNDIPVIYEPGSHYYFDHNILEEFNINLNVLPKGSTILNKQPNFYEKNYEMIWISATTTTILAIFLFLLLKNNLKYKQIIDRLNAKEKHIVHLANYDELTQLPNKSLFLDTLNSLIKAGLTGGLVLIDIDDFKRVNDVLGHVDGDNLLKEVANRLLEIEKKRDGRVIVSRYGGDEFLIIVKDVDCGVKSSKSFKNKDCSILDIIDDINKAFIKPFVVNDKENYMSLSMGITCFPRDGETTDILLVNADTAMYHVKKTGKNGHMFYSQNMQAEIVRNVSIENLIRDAIQNDGFKLVYQPQIDTITGEIVSLEALLRMKDNNISPGIFIPIAEELNFIIEIGRWTTKSTIMQMAHWKSMGFPLKPVAINFSSKQIHDHGYIDFLRFNLERFRIDPKYIEIEITENVLLTRTDNNMDFLETLKELGVSIALDDFGTGYSSLSYLTFIPVDKVKLDKQFCDFSLEQQNMNIMNNLISLIHNFGLETTAEGVEDFNQYKRLKVAGCNYIQGYLFSKPLDVEEINEIYNDNLLEKISLQN